MRIKQAEALLWRGRVEDAIALFDNCHSRQAITGLTQLAHGDECSRPNPITVTRPLRLQVDKQSKMLYLFLIEPGGRSSTRARLTYTA